MQGMARPPSGLKNGPNMEAGQLPLDFENSRDGVHPVPFSTVFEPPAPFDCTRRFNALMSVDSLRAVFEERFKASSGKGIDRINGYQFSLHRMDDLLHASRKCLAGVFRFTPYLEVLKPKGRDAKPRLISIPTIRDRVILHQLKELLSEAFPECVPKSIAATIVREVSADLPGRDMNLTFVAGCDIKKFYDTLHRDRLMKHISRRIKDPRALTLLESSIVTPTVPAAAQRIDHAKYHLEEGVPQGLSTSNIMAAIYLYEVDEGMRRLPIKYFRYVDDVLIYGTESEVRKGMDSFVARTRRRGLAVHKVGGGKSHLTKLSEEFWYLGYVFKGRSVTVRPATVGRLLQSLAAKFSDFRYNKDRQLERHKFLDLARLKDIFLHELNERITGAIRGNRRYGWVAYFSQITDLSLLHKLDFVVRGMFRRLPEFEGTPPSGLKSFARSFFEMKYRPLGGYVRNFDLFTTRAAKLTFLLERGRVAPDDALTNEQIDDRFDRYMNRVLNAMQADEANIY